MSLKEEKSLVVYFSRADENYFNGMLKKLEVGNTEKIAKEIAKYVNADVFKVETTYDYPAGYSDCCDVAETEKNEKKRPELKEVLDSIDDYRIIYIGYPIWHDTMPMAMFSFLEIYKFDNKIIMPFCTHEGSGSADSELDIKITCKGAMIAKPIALKGCFADYAMPDVCEWIDKTLTKKD